MSFGGRGGAAANQYDDMAQMASMNMMMGIMKSCFADCVTDFRSSDLSGSEKTCGWGGAVRAPSRTRPSRNTATLAARNGRSG